MFPLFSKGLTNCHYNGSIFLLRYTSVTTVVNAAAEVFFPAKVSCSF